MADSRRRRLFSLHFELRHDAARITLAIDERYALRAAVGMAVRCQLLLFYAHIRHAAHAADCQAFAMRAMPD